MDATPEMAFYQDSISHKQSGESVPHNSKALNDWTSLPNKFRKPYVTCALACNITLFILFLPIFSKLFLFQRTP